MAFYIVIINTSKHFLKSKEWPSNSCMHWHIHSLLFLILCWQWVILWCQVRGPWLLSFRVQKPWTPTTPFFERKEPVCLAGQTGLLQRVHGPIMCRQTKAEAASKSLMQNLCSCGCFSGWKNQYCGPDARRWLSALWLTVKAERDWGATFTALEMEWSRVGLIV